MFETQLKKLLHIIDKLPKPDREKAVDILKISANHYSNLTVSQSLQDTEVATLAAVSQPYLTGEMFSTLSLSNQQEWCYLQKPYLIQAWTMSNSINISLNNNCSSNQHSNINSLNFCNINSSSPPPPPFPPQLQDQPTPPTTWSPLQAVEHRGALLHLEQPIMCPTLPPLSPLLVADSRVSQSLLNLVGLVRKGAGTVDLFRPHVVSQTVGGGLGPACGWAGHLRNVHHSLTHLCSLLQDLHPS